MRITNVLALCAFIATSAHGCSLVQRFAPAATHDHHHAMFAAASGSPLYVGPMAGRPTTGDVDGDGNQDVVVACGTCCGSPASPKSGHIVVLLGDGKGGFRDAEGSPIKVAPSVRKVALGDLNQDGSLDIVAAEHDSYEITVLLNNGRGTFKRAASDRTMAFKGPRPHTHDIALADVNNDHALDVLTTNANDGSISVLLGDGKGGFTPAEGSPVQAGRHPYDAIATADLNGDGAVDLVVPDLRGNAIVVLFGDAKGGFAPAAGSPVAVFTRPVYVAVADANGDGRLDIFATHDDVGVVDVLLGVGQGGFAEAAGAPIRLAAPVWGIVPNDLNRDGKVDLVLGTNDTSSLVVLLGDGKGGFAEQPNAVLKGGACPSHTAMADFNGDGRLDIVSGNYESGDVSIFLATR